MYGYVRPALQRLEEADVERFSAVYCGLCRVLGERCGVAARLILNYDFTFLAILLSAPAEPQRWKGRCPVHPLRGRAYCPGTGALELAADLSVILAWWQLRDGAADSGPLRGMKYRAAALGLDRAYRRARSRRPGFDLAAAEHLSALAALEAEGCPSMDRPADTFAALLRGIAGELEAGERRRVLEELLYHLGRWIYLVDAADDLKEDFAAGRYNPLIYRFALTEGRLGEEDRAALAITLDHSIRRMAAAYELWDFGVWSPILRATLYDGLYRVGSAVLEGRFQASDMRLRMDGRDKEQL